MKSRLYDELYPRLNKLVGIKSSFDSFYNSWWIDKCLNYTGDKLSDYYNIFFSRFVTFNALYNSIIYTKESVGLLNKKLNKQKKIIERGDKEKATTLMAKELSDSSLQLLFNKPKINASIDVLTDIIESKKFVIIHKGGQQVAEDDSLILCKLKSTDRREKFKGVLELLYNIRCNLFHGNKGYESNQLVLLKAVNDIIFYVVELLYEDFIETTNNLIAQAEKEIEQLEKKTNIS